MVSRAYMVNFACYIVQPPAPRWLAMPQNYLLGLATIRPIPQFLCGSQLYKKLD